MEERTGGWGGGGTLKTSGKLSKINSNKYQRNGHGIGKESGVNGGLNLSVRIRGKVGRYGGT